MQNRPLVSIYIPTHNRADLLTRAIDSVLAQTYENIEILICSDGSTDSTDDVMAQYCAKYSHIHYIKNIEPKGACNARNQCINLARGEYITGLDDDDIYHPQRIAHMVNVIEEKDAFVCSSLVEWDLNIKDTASFMSSKIDVVDCEKITLEQLLLDNVVGNQILAKTEKLKSINGFCEEMPAWQDYDTWVRMLLAHGEANKIVQPLYVADIDRSRNRITSSDKRIVGCKKFYKRYWHLMNSLQRKNAELRLSIFKREKLPLFKLLSLFNIAAFKNWLRAFAIKLGYKL